MRIKHFFGLAVLAAMTASSVFPTQSKHQPAASLSADDDSNVPLQIHLQAYCPRDILPGFASVPDKPAKTFSYPLAMFSRLHQSDVLRVSSSRQSSILHVPFRWYDRLGSHLLHSPPELLEEISWMACITRRLVIVQYDLSVRIHLTSTIHPHVMPIPIGSVFF